MNVKRDNKTVVLEIDKAVSTYTFQTKDDAVLAEVALLFVKQLTDTQESQS